MQRPRSIHLIPENLVKQRMCTETNWSKFIGNPNHNDLMIRDIIFDSWRRCLSNGISPSLDKTKVLLENDEINEIIQLSYLYEHALPILQQLSEHVKDTNYLVTLADNNGKILFVDGNRKVLHDAEQMNFVRGADWSEKAIGTNAIGTSLAIGKSVQVFAAEHFCEGVQKWVCSSTPIHNPISRDILGVIDVTGLWQNAQSHSIGMTVMTAQTIENNLFRQYKDFHYHLLNEFALSKERHPGDGVIVVDEAFRIVEANFRARQTVLERTNKDLLKLWTEQEFHNLLLNSRRPVEQGDMYDIVMEQICMKASIREIQQSGRRIGFILIIRPTQERACERGLPPNSYWSSIIGKSDAIRSVVKKCDVASQTDVPILLQGESGTGKECFARSIHNTSLRRHKPFVAINCGAIPKDLMASELFGFEGGTFTGAAKSGRKGKFEEANGGTIFLDEIEEMSAQFQVYLLRVLQEKEVVRLGTTKPIPVDVRIIAASNQNVEELIQRGMIRADLYYRISVVNVTLPPLRDRREDIPLFIQHVIENMKGTIRTNLPSVEPQAFRFLTDIYKWQGNVRELENVFTHAILFCQGGIITMDDLPPNIQNEHENWQKGKETFPVNSAELCCEWSNECDDEERTKLIDLLQTSSGNLSEVSRRLGVARTTVYRRLRKLGIL